MAELVEARQAADDKRMTGVRMEHARATERKLTQLDELINALESAGGPADAAERLREETDLLRKRLRHGTEGSLDEEIERLRGRAVRLRPSARDHGSGGDRGEAVAALALRLADLGPQAAVDDPEGHRECTGLLVQLRAAREEGRTARFEALRGTIEHRLTRHAAAVEAAAAHRRTEAVRESERVARQQEADRLAAEEEQRRREAVAEATDRLGTIADAVRDAIRDAEDFTEITLAHELRSALSAVTEALDAGRPDDALAAVARLEEGLPRAEAMLDELLLAYERRAELARALQHAMAGAGFSFTGGADEGQGLLLHFARTNGALYSTTVASTPDGAPVLAYRVEGEADMSAVPDGAEVACDRTEDLLDQVHDAMADDGFVPGELLWEGKPPGGRGRGLPGARTERRR